MAKLLLFTHQSFSHQRQPIVFHRSLSDSKSPHVSRTPLSILAVLNNAVVWMVSTRPPTSKSSSLFNNPLDTAPNAPITICIIVTGMFQSFFNSLARSRYLSFFSHSFGFILWSAGRAKSTILQILPFFFFHYYKVWSSGRDQLIRLLLLLLLLFTHQSFSHQRQPMIFYWSLSDSKSLQVSRTLLSILAVLNNAVVWLVSNQPPTSKCSRPLSKTIG